MELFLLKLRKKTAELLTDKYTYVHYLLATTECLDASKQQKVIEITEMVDSAADSNIMIRQVHDLLARSHLSVSVAADSEDGLEFSGDREVFGSCGSGVVSTGWPQLDAIFPEGGLRPGMLLECLGTLQGGGVALLGLWFAWQMFAGKWGRVDRQVGGVPCSMEGRQGGVFIVFDNDRRFYPPAAAALGIALDRLMIIRPENKQDLYWALDQVLRCPAVGAVWSSLPEVSGREFRRLQLAAESGRALGVVVREKKFGKTPTWAHVRLQISALPAKTDSLKNTSDWRFRVERKRAVSAMVGQGMAGQAMEGFGCEVDLREVAETSGTGQLRNHEWKAGRSEQTVYQQTE